MLDPHPARIRVAICTTKVVVFPFSWEVEPAPLQGLVVGLLSWYDLRFSYSL